MDLVKYENTYESIVVDIENWLCCIDYLFDIDDYNINNAVKIKVISSKYGKSYFYRRRMDDDLMIVRNILHINMSICLLIVQFLFLFGIDGMKYKVKTKS